ncbi:BlaI/MecI/CopY family transcriptional regulator [Frankia sp. AgB1.9]|uniref:BlaI/MecI/CopY family transcriptional regulator n=1 Tax=unclassified Frankia TaxID=2632575 RepID=UPI00193329F4|nr:MULTISPECIES: BlaI/MecI/CopY family transcriptional regulator [unclassified Frankia]MBL7489943.1 BlaI/MecI/CopY family transcriptional regulator [Frankia sp. AgW1.1]MBL7552674.1 BlaI/MecI/CopY family transcriptional regulator [Frankia sp. AgB1.9]MBL7623839.1 BlaI/MecI/CopY family transcriptional regulator [Frankia sp. AgB1.8]
MDPGAGREGAAQRAPVGRRPAGALEGEVLALLWASGTGLTAAQVHTQLPADLAYKTVLTVLARLHDKGLCDREPVGRAHRYTPRRGPAELAAERMNAALASGVDPAAVMLHFVAGLNPDAEAALRAVLDGRHA